MPGHLMVLNPMAHKRRRKLTAKQLAAGFGGKAHKRKRRSGGRRRKARRKAAVKIIEVKSNPSRGRKMAKRKHRRHHRRRFRSNPIRRRFRRNPLESGFLSNTLGPAAWGAGGAILSNWLQNMLPLPAGFQLGLMAPITQIGYALVVGYGVDAVAGQQRGSEAAAGGMILAFYNLFSQLLGGGYYGGQSQQVARYLGYLRANPAQLAVVNRQRALRGLQPINAHPNLGQMPVGIAPLNPRFGLGAGRMMRMARQVRGRGLGYVGPARTLGRYMQ